MSKTKTAVRRATKAPTTLPATLPPGELPPLTWADVIQAMDAVYPGRLPSDFVYVRSPGGSQIFDSRSTWVKLYWAANSSADTPEEREALLQAARKGLDDCWLAMYRAKRRAKGSADRRARSGEAHTGGAR